MISDQYLSLVYVLFGKGKCRQAAVPATVPGTKARDATVDHPWEGESVGSPGARRPASKSTRALKSTKATFATGDCGRG